MKEYLILSQKDKWFSGRFDPEILQQVINDHARKGWVVKAMTNTSREGALMGGGRDELIVLLERDVKAAAAPPPTHAGTNGGGLQRMVQKIAAEPAANGEPDVYRLD